MKNRFNLRDQAQPSWLERAHACASLIRSIPDLGSHASIADVGCGDAKLRIALEESGPRLEYAGFDPYPQAADIQRLDITRQKLPRVFDIVAMLGVTEYLPDMASTLRAVAPMCHYLVVSHVVADRTRYSPAEIARFGWLNHKTEGEIESMLDATGYVRNESRVTGEGRTVLWLAKTGNSHEPRRF